MSTHANVYEAVSAAMVDIGGVSKSRDNKMQGFKYRGIADVSLAVQPALAKHGLCIAPYEIHTEEWEQATTKNGGVMMHCRMRIEFRCYHATGTWLPVMVTGEAMDTGDKTANKVMAVSLKYALCQLFCIPEEDPEIDTDAHSPGNELAPKGAQAGSPKGVTAGVPTLGNRGESQRTSGNGGPSDTRDPKAGPAGVRSAGPAASLAAPAHDPPAFPRVTMAQAKQVSEALSGLLPEADSASRAEYVAWAIGRKPSSAGDLNTAEATLLLEKIKRGEVPGGEEAQP